MTDQFLNSIKSYLSVFCKNHDFTIEQKINQNEAGEALMATINLSKFEIEIIVRGAYNTDYFVVDTELLKEIYYQYTFYGESGIIHFSEQAIFSKWKKDFENIIQLVQFEEIA